MNTELNRNIRKRWLRYLFEFGHLEFQKRLWIKDEYSDSIGNYGELLDSYFLELDLENGYHDYIIEEVINQKELEIVIDFHNQLDLYTERPEKKSLSDKNILRDPEWINLTSLAKTNWNKLKMIITDKDELDFMNELEKEFLK